MGQSFRDLGVDGSIVIYDKNNARFYEHNPSRNTTPFLPASTFKIFNSLVSLETGVIKDDVAMRNNLVTSAYLPTNWTI